MIIWNLEKQFRPPLLYLELNFTLKLLIRLSYYSTKLYLKENSNNNVFNMKNPRLYIFLKIDLPIQTFKRCHSLPLRNSQIKRKFSDCAVQNAFYSCEILLKNKKLALRASRDINDFLCQVLCISWNPKLTIMQWKKCIFGSKNHSVTGIRIFVFNFLSFSLQNHLVLKNPVERNSS